MFANCLTIEKLIEKLERTAQIRWFYYQAEDPDQMKREAFESWLEVEGRVAVKHRQQIIAASFIAQPELSAEKDINRLEALRPESGSGAQVASSARRKQRLGTPRAQLWH